MVAVVPYDPPPRSRSASRRSTASSIFDRVHEGLVAAEHLADEAGQVAAGVGKAARTAQLVEEDVERAYGGSGGEDGRGRASGRTQSSPSHAGRAYGDDTTEGESEGEARAGLIPPGNDKVRPCSLASLSWNSLTLRPPAADVYAQDRAVRASKLDGSTAQEADHVQHRLARSLLVCRELQLLLVPPPRESH